MYQSFILSFAILAAQWVAGQDAPVETDTPSQTTQKEPPNFQGEDTPYQIVPNTNDVPAPEGDDLEIMNKVGTWLYSYTGCKDFPGAKGKIDGAYYDSWVRSCKALVTPFGAVKSSNSLAVICNALMSSSHSATFFHERLSKPLPLEFLGAPGLNKDKQPQIQAVIANIATVIYSYKIPLFQYYIKVRCDDPKKRCQKRPDNDPCQPDPPNDGDKPKPTPLAYLLNRDPDDTDYPFINFCEGFLNRRSLADAIIYGKALKSPENLKLGNYDNRAQTFYVSKGLDLLQYIHI
ncbi:MAG: hypothetical protein L6R42_006149 [Xanthoria sp. 1 TBL-2021]|nr:MAG: hypothetical protein L6R42_006149 [Xanthoria sp. 1 TBL-2021]